METKIVIRLLSESGELLGWGALMARPYGDGALWPMEPLSGYGEMDGTAVVAHIHWTDINAQARAPISSTEMRRGRPFMLTWNGPILRLDNPADHPPLIPVTIRGPVEIGVPTGSVGLRTGS